MLILFTIFKVNINLLVQLRELNYPIHVPFIDPEDDGKYTTPFYYYIAKNIWRIIYFINHIIGFILSLQIMDDDQMQDLSVASFHQHIFIELIIDIKIIHKINT
ncbi:hypothetical protein ACJX0J_017351 [Zea mays]